MDNRKLSLVIFTCEGREYLLSRTYQSFTENCDYKFEKVILAIDGEINQTAIEEINPDVVIQQRRRSGYVNSIDCTLKTIKTPYFFWLEDDWTFNSKIDLDFLVGKMEAFPNWTEIVLNKTGPLGEGQKTNHLIANFYQNVYGFSANPSLCSTKHLQQAFLLLATAPKGSKLGEDGFENFLSRTFEQQGLKTVILDPVDHSPILHEGYLESTPRSWHMTNSLEDKEKKHLLIIAPPSVLRRLLMFLKLLKAFLFVSFGQFLSNKIYEYGFRIVTTVKSISKNG